MITPKTFPFSTRLPGTFNQYNCLAAIATCYGLGLANGKILSAVASFRGVPGRMEVLLAKPFTVIVDFAHTPNAFEQVLKTVRPVAKKRLIHVFGSAALRDTAKRPIMGSISGKYADIIVLTEEDCRTEDVEKIMDAIASGIPPGKPVYRFPNRSDAVAFAIQEARFGDLVLLTGKGHEQTLCRGKTEYPWSDQKAVKEELRKRKLH